MSNEELFFMIFIVLLLYGSTGCKGGGCRVNPPNPNPGVRPPRPGGSNPKPAEEAAKDGR